MCVCVCVRVWRKLNMRTCVEDVDTLSFIQTPTRVALRSNWAKTDTHLAPYFQSFVHYHRSSGKTIILQHLYSPPRHGVGSYVGIRRHSPSGHHGYLTKEQHRQEHERSKTTAGHKQTRKLGLRLRRLGWGNLATDYRGPLIVNEQEEAQSNADSCGDVVDKETDVDDVEGGTPDPHSQEEEIAQQM